MPTENQPIESHEVHSRRLIRHAEDELDRDDRLQASEKAWGAVAHYLKVIADQRGWQYRGHADAHRVARALAEEQGNQSIYNLFGAANQLHINFYLDAKSSESIRTDIERVKSLLTILRGLD